MTEQNKAEPKKKKYYIEFDREGCIGAAACIAAAPTNWVMQEDGKPIVLRREITEEELQENIDAARVCPVRVIKIVDEEGNTIAP